MDKNAIKKFAVWARRELIARVSQRAQMFGISKEDIGDPDAESVNGHLLSQSEKRQRQALIGKIRAEGYEQVMEEVAYTWFNRFAALRFMEVNGYLPSHVRVFTNDAGEFKPQILTEAIHLELEGLDMDRVYELEDANKSEELYKYLLITQCNALNGILPGMFQRISDCTELLFPDNLLRKGSVVEQMITMIPEEDWTDQVQIIGWLYQYYISEKKDEVFAALKKNNKISKENIPAATQLFTPDWIVRYMVENSLGRLWIEKLLADRSDLRAADPDYEERRQAAEKELAERFGWRYYLPETIQSPEVRNHLIPINKRISTLEEIKVIDPCCGSGHVLCVLFDVLVQIYEDYGYTAREAAVKIVEHNLYGLDIDDRAGQLAYFAVMMKARKYNRSIFNKQLYVNVGSIIESNHVNRDCLKLYDDKNAKIAEKLLDTFHDAKEYGSIINVTFTDDELLGLLDQTQLILNYSYENIFDTIRQTILRTDILPLLNQALSFNQKYDAVVTNPPYMGSSGMDAKLSEFVKKNYPDSKSDLFAVFIERCGAFTKPNGYQAMITQHAWMFLSSYEKLRGKLQTVDTDNMAHLGARAFEEIGGEVVQTTSFVFRNMHTPGYLGTYCRLIEPTTQKGKEDMFLAGENRYTANQDNFSKIPGSPVAYWVSEKAISGFAKNRSLRDFADPRQGLATGKDEEFLRYWFEVPFFSIGIGFESETELWISKKRYVPFNKGGSFRRWYGNNEYVISFDEKSYNKLSNQGNKLPSKQYYFHEGVTWSALTSGLFSGRFCSKGFVFAGKGPMCFSYSKETHYLCALMNSKPFAFFYRILSATMDFNQGTMRDLPFIKSNEKKVDDYCKQCIGICQIDWDSFETSWDFKQHPLI